MIKLEGPAASRDVQGCHLSELRTPKGKQPQRHGGHTRQHRGLLLSDSTSYASAISLNLCSAYSLLSGFLSGCHFSAAFLYLHRWTAMPTQQLSGGRGSCARDPAPSAHLQPSGQGHPKPASPHSLQPQASNRSFLGWFCLPSKYWCQEPSSAACTHPSCPRDDACRFAPEPSWAPPWVCQDQGSPGDSWGQVSRSNPFLPPAATWG